MKKINKLIFTFIIMNFLYSCDGFSDAGKVLRNEKKITTDEYLVKKRESLTLPPDYKNLPEPKSKDSKKKNNEDTINKILKIPKTQVKKNGSSTVEQSIINQIRK